MPCSAGAHARQQVAPSPRFFAWTSDSDRASAPESDSLGRLMSASQAWIDALSELKQAGTACAVVVVTAVRGSAPREPGARMIVAGGRLAWGTIGGGNLEKLAIEHATRLLAANGPC